MPILRYAERNLDRTFKEFNGTTYRAVALVSDAREASDIESMIRSQYDFEDVRAAKEFIENGGHWIVWVTPSDRYYPGLPLGVDAQKWMGELARFSDKIPTMSGETFSRDTIYRDRK